MFLCVFQFLGFKTYLRSKSKYIENVVFKKNFRYTCVYLNFYRRHEDNKDRLKEHEMMMLIQHTLTVFRHVIILFLQKQNHVQRKSVNNYMAFIMFLALSLMHRLCCHSIVKLTLIVSRHIMI